MYADPALIRKRYGHVNLSDPEAQLVDAIVAYTGGEKGAVVRELLLERAAEILAEISGDSDALIRGKRSS